METIITDLEALRHPSEPFKFIKEDGPVKDEIIDVMNKLAEVLNPDEALVAVSAPMIGIAKRIFSIKFDKEIKTFINPIITKKSNFQIAGETFGSMPGKEILLGRPEEIQAVYYTEKFNYEDNKLLGLSARVFDQMIDTLDGVLPDQLGLISDVERDGSLKDLTEDEIPEIIDMYKQFVANRAAAFKQNLDTSDAEGDTYRKLKFMEDVVNGRSQVIMNEPHFNRAQRRAAARASKKIERMTNK